MVVYVEVNCFNGFVFSGDEFECCCWFFVLVYWCEDDVIVFFGFVCVLEV